MEIYFLRKIHVKGILSTNYYAFPIITFRKSLKYDLKLERGSEVNIILKNINYLYMYEIVCPHWLLIKAQP